MRKPRASSVATGHGNVSRNAASNAPIAQCRASLISNTALREAIRKSDSIAMM